MAIVVNSVVPADAATGVVPNTPVVVDLENTTGDLDHNLVDIVVNGVSNTNSNGDLDFWGIQKISGGAYVADLGTVVYATLRDWYTNSSDSVGTIAIDVEYNSVNVSSTTFSTFSSNQGHRLNGAEAYIWLEAPLAPGAGALLQYWTEAPPEFRSTGSMWYNARPRNVTKADLYWVAGYLIQTPQATSVVVGNPVTHPVPTSTVVKGFDTEHLATSVIVQGYFVAPQPCSTITSIRFRYAQTASTYVGVDFVSKLPASMVVYGVVRESTLEIDVQDASTKTLLEGLGIVFS